VRPVGNELEFDLYKIPILGLSRTNTDPIGRLSQGSQIFFIDLVVHKILKRYNMREENLEQTDTEISELVNKGMSEEEALNFKKEYIDVSEEDLKTKTMLAYEEGLKKLDELKKLQKKYKLKIDKKNNFLRFHLHDWKDNRLEGEAISETKIKTNGKDGYYFNLIANTFIHHSNFSNLKFNSVNSLKYYCKKHIDEIYIKKTLPLSVKNALMNFFKHHTIIED
jgi:hypothetical protein